MIGPGSDGRPAPAAWDNLRTLDLRTCSCEYLDALGRTFTSANEVLASGVAIGKERSRQMSARHIRPFRVG